MFMPAAQVDNCLRTLLNGFFELSLISVHEKVLNLSHRGLCISLINAPYPAGPGRIICFPGYNFLKIAPNSRIYFKDDVFYEENRLFSFSIRNASYWQEEFKNAFDCKMFLRGMESTANFILSQSDLPLREFLLFLKESDGGQNADRREISDPVYKKIVVFYSEFIESFSNMEVREEATEKFCKNIIGMGYGLTPSGDDFLSGFLSALSVSSHFFPCVFLKAARLQKDFLKFVIKMKHQTTDLSGGFLLYSAQGRVSQEILDLTDACCALDMDRIKANAQWFCLHGHSSGREILAGFYSGIFFVVKNNMQALEMNKV